VISAKKGKKQRATQKKSKGNKGPQGEEVAPYSRGEKGGKWDSLDQRNSQLMLLLDSRGEIGQEIKRKALKACGK